MANAFIPFTSEERRDHRQAVSESQAEKDTKEMKSLEEDLKKVNNKYDNESYMAYRLFQMGWRKHGQSG